MRCATPITSTKLATDGFTGKGQTIVIFAFDGFDQADLDSFATLYESAEVHPDRGRRPAGRTRAARPRWISKSPMPSHPTHRRS